MREYEMRLHRPDGALSVVMKTIAIDDHDAKRLAYQFLIGDIARAYIFSGDKDLGAVERIPGRSIAQTYGAVSSPPLLAAAC